MTSKDKAIDLVTSIKRLNDNEICIFLEDWKPYAKECAMYCVDEIIEAIKWQEDSINNDMVHTYWQSVKTEIEKL